MGVVLLSDAMKNADSVGLDLVEVAPNSNPPVCRILDFGKMKYEAKKKEQQSKKKQHVVKLKEIRIRPRIDDHDLETKMNMGKKFLSDGFKLKVTLMFRGREMSRLDLGDAVMEKVVERLKDISEIEKQNPLEGNRMSLIFNGK